jgi:AcrR family transcriptional regulator
MQRLSRQAWIEAGLCALDASPEPGLSIERLARQLGVTRGSFYHHFKGRRDLVVALLQSWEESHTQAVIAHANAAESAPERLRRWIECAGALPSGREVALRRWADREPLVAACLSRVEQARLGFLEALAAGLRPQASAEARARLVRIGYLAFIGLQQRGPRQHAQLAALAEDWLALLPEDDAALELRVMPAPA